KGVGIRKRGRLEEGQEPRERRPQLVRDGGREAGAKLLVGAQVAGRAEVEQRLAAAVDLVRDGERHGAALDSDELRRQRPPLLEPLQRLARAPARADDALLLVQDDDEVIGQGMARHLAAAGFDPLWVTKGEQGLARLRYERPDVCVLDLMLPQTDGWSIIEAARADGIGTPIVVVSARGTEHDRIHALEIGADDYLVKPFSMKELVARVQAAARRGVRVQEPARGEPIEIEELRID